MTKDSNEFVDTTHLVDAARIAPKGDHERGPPNRLNDLNYSDWMKYQKSFYRYPDDQTAVAESIYFFTKERYDGERISRTLLVGFDAVECEQIETDRSIDHRSVRSLSDVLGILDASETNAYDYVLVDVRALLSTTQQLTEFLETHAEAFWAAIRDTVVDERFAGIFVELPSTDGRGFPIPWSVAGSSRNHVRLKDEKVGLIEDRDEIVYNLHVQATDDLRESTWLHPEKLQFSRSTDGPPIPPWIIPKPPARDDTEILHPAKYPETLIEQFINLFTDQGDVVFDPMVGTGSTVLAAIQNERDGYGIDLNDEYVEIAQNRVENEYRMTLSGEIEPHAESQILQGDATKLDVDEFASVSFDYVVTSPPYWSMLNNSGSENQKQRRENGLPLTYSESESDLGNIEAYDDFLDTLEVVYDTVSEQLASDGHLTIIIKNVKRDHIIYPLAWDLVERLCGPTGAYEYVGNTLWCQDDIGLKPFAVGTHWVSNTLHNYCLHFKTA